MPSPTADEQAAAVYAALQRQDGVEAARLARAGLAAVEDRPLLRARLLAWLAQALLLTGDLEGAGQAVAAAIRTARAAGDTAGVSALRGLQAQVLARLNPAPAPALPDTPVGRACAALDAGDHVRGEALASAALEAATEPRDQVLCLLAVARVPGRAAEAIERAAAIADTSGDQNLVTAVARAARAAGVDLGIRVF